MIKVYKVILVQQVLRVLKGLRVLKVYKVILVPQVLRVSVGQLVQQVQLVHPALKVKKEK